jgi:phosphatidylglycerophosphatase A
VTRQLLLGLASVGYISILPHRVVPFQKWKGGGLLGSLAGWGLLWLLPPSGPILGTAVLIALVLSIPICGYAERQWTYDDPRIVLDELVGVWIACWGLPRQMAPMLAGLVLFRVFDVWKGPWGRTAARLPGGWGVVADDVAAGLIAALLIRAAMAAGFFLG